VIAKPAWPAHWASDVVLADGGTAHVRPIFPADAPGLLALHARLSRESIYLRFFSPHPRLSERELAHFTHVDHDARVALVVLLGDELIAVGRYDRVGRSDAAEVAFVVDDAQQRRGIATLLLERLVAAARDRGLHRFTADVLPHNRGMLSVFHDAGFEVTSRFVDGVVRLDFPIDRTPRAVSLAAERARAAEVRSIGRLLAPRGIGVIAEGAAAGPVAEELLRSIADGGFRGPVRRLAAHAPAGETSDLDVVFVAVPPELQPAQLERCAEWGVHAAVLLATGAPGDEAPRARGDHALATRARREGLRLLGPASLGLLRTVSGVALAAVAAPVRVRCGRLALFTESPARGRDALEAVAAREIGLSTFLSAGRKSDISASDALQFWERDAATGVIALALRSLGNPRRSAAIVRRVARRKPVLVWLTDLPLAPPAELVRALVGHTGAIPCTSLDDLLEVASALLSPEEPAHREDVSARIAAWERWRGAARGRPWRAEGVDPFAARRMVDSILGESPAGAPLSHADVAALAGSYGVALDAAERSEAGPERLRVAQDSAWGSIVEVEGEERAASARLVPLTDRDVRRLATFGPRVLRPGRVDLVGRIATLVADVPELASLSLALPSRHGDLPALVRGSARLAPWTLGPALPEAGAV
jgi:RimJ/RimL family protein N-acetyltransferase/succinyl-CoA synthetase alpha subunit